MVYSYIKEQLEQNLIRDIQEFVQLCPELGKPTPEEVMDWARYIYGKRWNSRIWAEKLIEGVTDGQSAHFDSRGYCSKFYRDGGEW